MDGLVRESAFWDFAQLLGWPCTGKYCMQEDLSNCNCCDEQLLKSHYIIKHTHVLSVMPIHDCHTIVNNLRAFMPMQLYFLYLGANKLVGSVPESWGDLISVRHCCKALHLLIDAGVIVSTTTQPW